jgi:hypothetical protein
MYAANISSRNTLFYKSLDLDKGCNILNFQFYFEKLILYPLYSYKIF